MPASPNPPTARLAPSEYRPPQLRPRPRACSRSWLLQVFDERGGDDGGRLLGVGQVRGLRHHQQPRPGDPCDDLQFGRGVAGSSAPAMARVGAVMAESCSAQIEFGDGFTACRVAFGGASPRPSARARCTPGFASRYAGLNSAFHHRRGQPTHRSGPRPVAARSVHAWTGGSWARCTATPSAHPFGVADRYSHDRHPAQRQTDQMGPRDLKPIQQGHQIIGQIVDGVRALGHQDSTVAAGVIAHHPEALLQVGQLRVPHAVGGAQRVGQHDRRGVRAPVTTACTSTALIGPPRTPRPGPARRPPACSSGCRSRRPTRIDPRARQPYREYLDRRY